MRKALFALFLLSVGIPASAQDGKGQVVLTPMAGVNVSWMAPNQPTIIHESFFEACGCFLPF